MTIAGAMAEAIVELLEQAMRIASTPRRSGAVLLFVASVASCALAISAYFAPLTGVNGSLGALIVIAASLILALAALLLVFVQRRGWHNLLRILILLGLIGTGFAGLLLHRWWISVAIAVGLIGLIIDVIQPRQKTGRARSDGTTA